MTLATDLYLSLSNEETLITGMPGSLKGLVGAFSSVVSNLISESPSLSKFFPAPSEIASWDLTEGPINVAIGGYELGIEVIGLLNKPGIIGIEDENKLHLIVDLSIIREGSDVPFISTIGLSKVDGIWEEFIPSIESIYTYDAISDLGVWFEGFLRAGMIEHRFVPASFDIDGDDLLIEDISDEIIDIVN